MHPEREKLIQEELENATALSLTLNFSGKVGNLPITHTLDFEGMPALLLKSNGKHIVKCLPLNQLGIGDTIEEAIDMLREDLSEILTDVIGESNFLKSVGSLLEGRAAPLYWEKHKELSEAAAVITKAKPKEEPTDITEIHPEMMVNLASAEEYKEHREALFSKH